MQFPLSSRVLFFLYKSECVVLKIEVPPLSGPRRYVHFGVCAPQSASFALTTTHSPDVLLNASRPTTQLRTILYKSTRRSRGETIGTHIDRDNPLIMSLRLRGATQQNATHSRTAHQVRRSYARRRCGSCFVFERANSVYK